MNFYLDFEATQFSERIISIGCVADNGNEFNTLVKPPKGDKVNQFITDLTGITQKMVEKRTALTCASLLFVSLSGVSPTEKKPSFSYMETQIVILLKEPWQK